MAGADEAGAGRALARLGHALERLLVAVLTIAFGALVLTVLAQVTARNVLEIPLVWTLDLAQLLFAWCIFLGAAVAYRRGGHYVLDVVPASWRRLSAVVDVIADVASLVVIVVLVRYGFAFTSLGVNRTSEALGISQLWFYLPIPLAGLAMALFFIERQARRLRGALA